MLRILVILLAVGAAWIFVDAHWDKDARTLTLRIREASELVESVRDRSRELGRRVVDSDDDELPDVAAVPGDRELPAPPPAPRSALELPEPAPRLVGAGERITSEEQARLDRIIAETTQGR